MSEDTIGFLVLVFMSVLLALIFHWCSRNYLRASCGAAFSATVAFQIVSFVYLGYLDPFFIIALVTGGAVGLAVAFIVGAPFLFARRKAKNRHAL